MKDMPEHDVAFDKSHYRKLNEAREAFLRECVSCLASWQSMTTALDVGCGAGYFSGVLRDLGLTVTGVDLQEENLANCRARYPDCDFRKADLDGPLEALAVYDLVLLFGVLYHLQSPLQTIMRLRESVGRVAVVSSRFAEGDFPAMYLFSEKVGQAHNDARVVTVPTLSAMISILNSAGFDFVYIPRRQPEHEQYRKRFGNGYRACLVCARERIDVAEWDLAPRVPPFEKWRPLQAGKRGFRDGAVGRIFKRLSRV
jgi:SAM-dependent methyltransferase